MVKKSLVCGLVVMVLGLGALKSTSQTQSRQDPKTINKPEFIHTQQTIEVNWTPVNVEKPAVDRLFTLLKVYRKESEELVKEELKVKEKRLMLVKAEQKILAEIRDIIQSQQKALTDTQKRLKMFEEALPSPYRPIPIGNVHPKPE